MPSADMANATLGHFAAVSMPEILLAGGTLVLLVYGVFRGDKSLRAISYATMALMIATMLLIIAVRGNHLLAFDGTFVVDAFSDFTKVLVLLASTLSIWISLSYLKAERLGRFEFPILVALSTVGMMTMISANDLIMLFVGLELQSLPLYVLAAFNRDSQRSTEAGLKYFVLSALSSGLLLYGCSLVYGFSGTTHFQGIADVLSDGGAHVGVMVGIVFILAGLAFKISAVPFQMWAPDVYEGAPTPITAFFAAAPKLAAMALFVRVVMGPFLPLAHEWRQVIVFMAAASVIWGAFAAIGQTNIKRLMAYSSIGHMGYALVGLAAGTPLGVRSVLIYMTLYFIMTLGTFVVILSMRRREGMVEEISDLAGLSRTRPAMAFALAVLMFSLAGIPPLAGFFGKFYVFLAAVQAGLTPLAVLAILASVVGAFYYLRIVKVMYLDEPAEPFRDMTGVAMPLVLGASTIITLFFFVFPGPLLKIAGIAASSFF
jgi:NADH-quinone oxidoreductase subunit N